MRKFLAGVFPVIIMILTACGTTPAPELNVTDIQKTALAIAMTNLAMTQAALPTTTSIPITDVPTLITMPTTALDTPTIAPIANSSLSPTADCYQPAPAKLSGTTVQIRLVNKSDGPVNLSMGMYAPNDRGECYTFAFFVSKNTSKDIRVLSGCYWIAGYQNGPKPSTPRVNYLCLDSTVDGRGLSIKNNSIGFD